MYSPSQIREIEKEIDGPYKIEKALDHFTLLGINIETKKRVSFKIISDIFHSYYEAARFLKNLQIGSKLNHENIIRIQGLENYEKSLIIISESLDTDLQQVILSRQDLSVDHRRYLVYQILRGLKYLHSANYVHNNLKPSNIEVAANCDVKIQVINTDIFYENIVCTRWYKAPEVLFSPDEKMFCSDVWSVGCILSELILRDRPLFNGGSTLNQLKKIVEGIGSPKDDDLYYLTNIKAINYMNSLPKHEAVEWKDLIPRATSDEIDLIKMMLVWNPSKRISVDEALKHPYFDILHDPSDEPCTSPIDTIDAHQYQQIPNFQKYFWSEVYEIRKSFK